MAPPPTIAIGTLEPTIPPINAPAPATATIPPTICCPVSPYFGEDEDAVDLDTVSYVSSTLLPYKNSTILFKVLTRSLEKLVTTETICWFI